MAEKLTRKEKIARQKKSVDSAKQAGNLETGRRSLKRILGLIVAMVGIVLYASTVGHEYVLDDFGLIRDNIQTKKGISAIPEIFKSSYRYGMNTTDFQLYRPLTKAMFAVEWNVAPNKPALGHVVNIILYAVLCYVLFRLLNRYMGDALLVPFLTALLFAAHPLHTEVVSNIKGRDEIVTLLLCLISTWSLHSYVTKNSRPAFIIGIVCYFVALFAKESAITFIAIIPFFYYFFTNAGSRKYFMTIIAMIVCTAIFLIIRRNVLGNVISLIPVEDNSLAAIKDIVLQKVNAIAILGTYLKLMVFPSPLIADGSYNHFPVIGLTSLKFIVPLIILIGAGIYAIIGFRKKDPVSLGILIFFATASLVSNVIILIGTNYGERLMFMPSMGFCLVVSVLLARFLKSDSSNEMFANLTAFVKGNMKPVSVVAIVVILFGIQSITRAADWKSDYTLYSHDVKKVPDSAHMLFYYANNITSEESLAALPDDSARNRTRREAIEYLSRSVVIYPKYADGYQRRGFIYYQMGNNELAEGDYKMALSFNPTHPIVYNNYGTLCFNQRRYEEAMTHFKQAVRYSPKYAHALNNVGSVYGVIGQGETEMITKDPANRQLHTDRAKQNFETAVSFFKLAIDADKEFLEPIRLIAVTYRNLGNAAEGERYDKLLQEVDAKKNAKN